MDKTGEDLDGLHLGKFEKRRPTFFQIYVSLYQNIIYTAGNHSQLLCEGLNGVGAFTVNG